RSRRRRPCEGVARNWSRRARGPTPSRVDRRGGGASTMTVELIQGLLLAFAIVVILMPPYIRLLRATGFTKQLRIEGADTHPVKHGTPTMGGALIIIVVLALYFLFRWPPEGGIFAPLAAIAGVGL